MEWTDDVISHLRAYWTEGLSTAEIGRRLGVTKNAIVGKAHRLDLPARPSPIRRDPDAEGAQRATARRLEGPTLPPLPSTMAEPETVLSTIVTASIVTASIVTVSIPPPRPSASPPAQVASAPPPPVPAASGPMGLGEMGPGEMGLGQVRPEQVAMEPRARAQQQAPADVPRVPSPRPLMPIQSRPMSMMGRAASPPARQTSQNIPRSSGRVVTCCWPIGEPGTRDFHFCDVPSEPGRPYCEEHVKVAYVRVRDRREDAA